ncbi:UDP-N-acetylmuramoyl-tripeptide--D-alanyl-D-alanine ligase [Streptococcus entericus]|uniref:UDP-N-acetylmuramoyl-tripeptide--D-alanyl-D- alanine ligase n=1 Tax=Streptococcus entericus TaxID=155680 RepID=UPI0003762A38|nr:UDP-N-acetylmuramoyl-tripeptide--D-alanyl-D-alanine ligase [Streptococcus entericus]
MKLTLHEIAQVVGAKNDVAAFDDLPLTGLEFDSRKIVSGHLFVPLKGARDGHDFIETAFENGAVATFSERDLGELPHLLVDNCLTALQELASYYIDKMQVEVIAVTGSNGKTTTKDMIAQVLATTYKTYKTQGNYNNEIGLPYTVLQMPDDTEKLVLEMGQDRLGDIALLSKIARPRLSVVTMIGEAHLEFFSSRAKIAEGKMQIADHMPDGGLLIVPDDEIILPFLPHHQTIIRAGQDIQLTELVEHKESVDFSVNFMAKRLHLPVTGKYNATNAMLAAYVGKELGVTEEAIVTSLAHLVLTRNRTEWKKASNGADLLSDVYNANPTAMRLILETFSAIPKNPGGQKIVVLADMKELGTASFDLHAQMMGSLDPKVLDRVFLYGEDIRALYDQAVSIFPAGRVSHFTKTKNLDQLEELTQALRAVLEPADQVLFKGSNSMNLSHAVEVLEAGDV